MDQLTVNVWLNLQTLIGICGMDAVILWSH